jgi:hypothetical protein
MNLIMNHKRWGVYFIGYLMMFSVSDGRMIDEELERNNKEAVMAQLGYYPGICLEGLSKTTKTVQLVGVLTKI